VNSDEGYTPTHGLGDSAGSRRMSYLEYLQVAANSRAIVELVREGQTGPASRYYDAILLDKLLITNNPDAPNLPYYNPRWVLSLDKLVTSPNCANPNSSPDYSLNQGVNISENKNFQTQAHGSSEPARARLTSEESVFSELPSVTSDAVNSQPRHPEVDSQDPVPLIQEGQTKQSVSGEVLSSQSLNQGVNISELPSVTSDAVNEQSLPAELSQILPEFLARADEVDWQYKGDFSPRKFLARIKSLDEAGFTTHPNW
jgi:hypothetical protein